MILLILFAFLAGLVTILSPCILPVLPIVLAGSVDDGKKRPLGIVAGFIASFTFFTLTLSTIVRVTGLPSDSLRLTAIVVIGVFGLSMVIPRFQIWMERLLSVAAGNAPNASRKSGFTGGVLVGMSLGLVWAPCVGPILASVITLAATSSVTAAAAILIFAYSVGTAIPMLGITYGGRSLLAKVPWLFANITSIQKVFGIIMIATAVSMYFNIDRAFQSYILSTFPEYGVGLTKFEDTPLIKKSLDSLTPIKPDATNIGKPMYDVVEPELGTAPAFTPGGEWINSVPLSIKSLRGKVILVDFWTYTCINCIRTLPYIKNWHEKYKDKGLIIVGVHTPEFEFEKNLNNVRQAVKDFGIQYPVMQDNNYATWQAYDNHYWPAKYLIDKNGRIRNTHFGEGDYDETESLIQKLLRETGAEITEKPNNTDYRIYAKSPEAYLGYGRIEYLSSPERIDPDRIMNFTAPVALEKNRFAYSGSWTLGREYAMPHAAAELTFHFDAGEVYLVMKSRTGKSAARLKISLDGNPVSADIAGTDVVNSIVTVGTDRLYKLLKLSVPGDHTIRIQFMDDNADVFAFTFG